MKKIDCDKFLEFLPSLVQGKLQDHELEALTEHIASCKQCLRAFALTAHLVKGVPPTLAKWLEPAIDCEACKESLPEYVEEEREKAKGLFPQVWLHLQVCPDCRQQEKMVRQLIASEEKLGPFPVVAWERLLPKSPNEPLIHKFTRVLRIFWEGARGKIEEVLPEIPRIAWTPAVLGVQHAALRPAHLGSEDPQVQKLVFTREGLELEVIVYPVDKFFTVVTTPRLPDIPLEARVWLELFHLQDEQLVSLGGENKCNSEAFLFLKLQKGVYQVSVESVHEEREVIWKVPLEIGQVGQE